QADHRAGKSLRWISLRHAITCNSDHHKSTTQSFNYKRRNKTAAVAADIDDQRFLSNLWEVELGKFIQTWPTHIRDMKVTDFTVRFFGHVIDVLLYPRQVVEGRLVRRGNNRHVTRSVLTGFRINSQNDLFICGPD